MNTNNLNFIFWGTPEVASATLEILKKSGYLPSLIITSPDAKSGRGLKIQASPVAVFAEKNNIPCLKPEKLEGKAEDIFATSLQADGPRKAIFQQENTRESKNNLRFDLFIVVAYGKIIPEKIINLPKLGSINIHYSLLPKYRGASPVEAAILNDDAETGVTIQKMEYALDSGPILAQKKVIIYGDEKAPELLQRLIQTGGELLVKILPDYAAGKIIPQPQDEKWLSYCQKIKKEDGRVDLEKDPPSVMYNKFRAYAAWPRTFFFYPPTDGGKRFIITAAHLDNGQFIIDRVIPEGGKEIGYRN